MKKPHSTNLIYVHETAAPRPDAASSEPAAPEPKKKAPMRSEREPNFPGGYVVQSGLSMPKATRKWDVYPFASMQVGDSFALKGTHIRELERVRSAAAYYAIRHPGIRFTVRLADPTTGARRCWRIS